MPRIHVLTPNLTPDDAVAQDALGMARVLRGRGQDVRLYADAIDPGWHDLGEPLDVYELGPSACPDDLLIYHHALGWQRGGAVYAGSRNQRVLKYHNVTPAAFYEGLHPDFTRVCAAGVAQTRELARLPAALWLADSDYSARELREMGADRDRVHTVPPFHNLEALDRVEADLEVLRRYQDGVRNILFVGRVVPNKGHLDLLATFAHYHRYLNVKSRLLVVGSQDPRLRTYVDRIRAAVEQAGLAKAVVLTGKVSPAQLKAYYLTAHAFLCVSHHEGFCVPLVEAMAYHVPVVAWGSTAVASTLGKDALVWEHLDPAVLAESLHACLERPEVNDFVVDRQRLRYERRFAPAAVARRFLAALSPLLTGVPV
jgi:glycosyltransferase involved in cell wall biosynthesis